MQKERIPKIRTKATKSLFSLLSHSSFFRKMKETSGKHDKMETKKCSIESCEGKHEGRMLCKKHYNLQWQRSNPEKTTKYRETFKARHPNYDWNKYYHKKNKTIKTIKTRTKKLAVFVECNKQIIDKNRKYCSNECYKKYTSTTEYKTKKLMWQRNFYQKHKSEREYYNKAWKTMPPELLLNIIKQKMKNKKNENRI